MFHCANCWFERWRGRSLSDSQHSHTATSSSCGNKCAHWEEVHCGSVRSTAGDGGISDTRTTHRLYLSIKREHIDRVSGS